MAASLAITEPSLFSLPTPETSLSSRAMLCTLSISMWSARKHDPDASEEIARLHTAANDAGRYNKLLIPRKSLEEIQKVSSPGESHPEALAELYVSLSTHTAPIMEPRRALICQWANKAGARREMHAIQCFALRRWDRSFLYFLLAHRARSRFSSRIVG